MISSEFALVETIRRLAGKARAPVALGIGDDCAVIDVRPGEVLLHTTDCLVEGVHFRREYFAAIDIGLKAVAVNLSDIAAMGGRPVAFLLTLVIPGRARDGRGNDTIQETGRDDERYLLDIVRGAIACGRKFGCQLAGGNVSSTRGDGLIVDVSMIGAAKKGCVLRRSGARPGDVVLVSGHPGQSSAGLALLNDSRLTTHDSRLRTASSIQHPASSLRAAHLRPQPMLALGRSLAERGLATACIDTSDGLVQDLGHICGESGVGAEIDAAKIPISRALRRLCSESRKDPLEFALGGGEDYGLLFTVTEKDFPKVRRLKSPVPITSIGRITRSRKVRITGCDDLRTSGFDHLK
ncbi:MAG: thiamine-phosphate kinase [Deltaproteobacteria bacterium]|nr:thiamine-phosphate kinase [Deltaproteobacteria bacterium]